MRSREQSLYTYFGYENKDLRDDTSNSHSLKSSRLWNLGLSGTFTDSSGRAVNDISLTQYWGSLGIHDSAEATNDAAGLQTAGHFAKTVLTYQRRQDIATSLSLHFDFTGQLAGRNLDSSEKLYLGGVNGVRAYPQGDAAGDEGLLARTELRWRLPGQRFQTDTWFLAGFYDYGQIKANHRPLTGTENSSHLTGAGLGLLWTCSRDAAIRLDYAWKTGHTAAEDGKNGRLWLQGVYYY